MDAKEKSIQNALELAASYDSSIIPNANIVYLMGTSFVLGSLFTILILILLDFMKRDRQP